MKLESDLVDQYDRLMSTSARRTFRRARVVACTASSAVHVVRRLNTAVAQNTDDDEDAEADLELTYVRGVPTGCAQSPACGVAPRPRPLPRLA